MLGKSASELPDGEAFTLKPNSSQVLGIQNSAILRLQIRLFFHVFFLFSVKTGMEAL